MSGRKGVKKAALDGACVEPLPGQSIMRVVSLRGSNLVEVEDGHGERTLSMMPAKFSKSLWIKRGNYVLVEEGDRQKVLEANGKVTGTIARVLYKDHVRMLQKTSFWPAAFLECEARVPAHSCTELVRDEMQAQDDSIDDSDIEDDNLPALEENQNRHLVKEMYESSSESDQDSEIH